MALRQRLIAKLLFDTDGALVKYRRFTEDRRIVGNPVSTIAALADQKLDEFHLCFLGPVDTALVRQAVGITFTPVSVAGSIRASATVDTLIRECCVDRVITRDAECGGYIAEHYGRQAAVYPITYTGPLHEVVVPPWAGEVLLTSVDRDGMMGGMDLGILGGDWRVPVTLAGGCGKLVHAKDALAAGADAVCISSMFAFTDKSPVKLRSWLVSEGANVRA